MDENTVEGTHAISPEATLTPTPVTFPSTPVPTQGEQVGDTEDKNMPYIN